MGDRPVANFYVDGYNLYRRRLEHNPHLKWLNLCSMAENLLPGFDIGTVHYFTATLKPRTLDDQRSATRQQVYLRALQTLGPTLQVHYGQFRSDRRWMTKAPLEVDPATGKAKRAQVFKMEEKGSDVNLAVQALVDAHFEVADLYVLLTNDSDQVGTINRLRQELQVRVGLVLPIAENPKRGSKELQQTTPDYVGLLPDVLLASSQFPDQILDAHGTISKPREYA